MTSQGHAPSCAARYLATVSLCTICCTYSNATHASVPCISTSGVENNSGSKQPETTRVKCMRDFQQAHIFFCCFCYLFVLFFVIYLFLLFIYLFIYLSILAVTMRAAGSICLIVSKDIAVICASSSGHSAHAPCEE